MNPWTICRHCNRKKVNRPRGLCWSCYYTLGVRELYPSTSKYAYRGVGNLTGVRMLPTKPTDALPGSEEKVRVLEQRAAAGVVLWHPDDAKAVGETNGTAPMVASCVMIKPEKTA